MPLSPVLSQENAPEIEEPPEKEIMRQPFLNRLAVSLKKYERPGARVQAMAELAPGIIAVFLMRWNYCFVIFFDRLSYGENKPLYSKPWERYGGRIFTYRP